MAYHYENAEELFAKMCDFDDKDAFRQLFEAFYAPLCVYAGRYFSGRDTTEDVVQEVFIKLWENRNRIVIGRSVRRYLMVMVRNHSVNLQKSGHARHLVNTDRLYDRAEDLVGDDSETLYTMNELRSRLSALLASMPEEYRVAFVLSRVEKLKTSEIAERMNVSERSVERYRSHAVEILKRHMKEYLPLLTLLLTPC